MIDTIFSPQDVLSIIQDMSRRKEPAGKMSVVYEKLRADFDASFPEDLSRKILGLIGGVEKVERNLSEEVREWVQSQDGHFSVTDGHKALDLVTPSLRHSFNVIMTRLKEKGIIEKHGEKSGVYRKVARDFQEQRWWEASGQPLYVRFPLGIHDLAKVFAGNTILLEGQKSQGKSAFALEFARLNRTIIPDRKVRYQNVEMSDDEIAKRIDSYPAEMMTRADWQKSVEFIRRTESWWDIVDPEGVNVIDYLIEYEKSYMIADFVWKIHKKLTTGIALVIVQRDPRKPYGQGGYNVRNIPRLIISLRDHTAKLEDVKSFWETLPGNPSGKARKYKQASWWKLLPDGDWGDEEETKYKEFSK